jgi:D-sedoheptulose 7-phosphate isomerase
MQKRIEATLRETAAVHQQLVEQAPAIEEMARRLAGVLSGGGTIYLMGNGGSAADCQHMAGELVGRFLMERAPLPCVALTTDTSILTAVGNDYGFDSVFQKQVAALVREGDAVIGFSTSGNSPNVLAGIEEARARGALTVAMTGGTGGRMAETCDLALVVRANATPRVQEGHATIIHILCDLIEQQLFGGARDESNQS